MRLTWMSGVSNDYMREAASGDLYGQLGLLLGPDTFGGVGAKADYRDHIPDYHAWGLDNGCFSNHGLFHRTAWLAQLDTIINEVDGIHESCRFAVAPDVFDPVAMKGDPIATIERSLPVLAQIRQCGAPAALVAQDGLEYMQDIIPWGEFDVLFVGGGDHFKLGHPHDWTAGDRELIYDQHDEDVLASMRLFHACHQRGVSIHVGRVNTQIRLSYAALVWAESCDGTLIARAGEQGLARMQRWLPELPDLPMPEFHPPMPEFQLATGEQRTFGW